MKEKLIRVFVNALLGALSSAATIYLGGSVMDATGAGAVTAASVGDTASNFVRGAIEGFQA